VGAEPESIVSTPGSVASFVGVKEAGAPGIYGLPTSCIDTRSDERVLTDVTTWPACRLPSAPGAMAIVIDPGVDADGDPTTPREIREHCSSVSPAASPAATRSECRANLALEVEPFGRRKLLVALPHEGEVVVIDAQELLDRTPGSFEDCTVEAFLPLGTALPASGEGRPKQVLPEDLQSSCEPPSFSARTNMDVATPADFALADGVLYVADSTLPLIHRLDVSDPCELSEVEPLLPMSLTQPGVDIPTSRVAVSPPTSKNERFVYAVDASASSTAGSVMVFDVSPGSTDLTPIVRERSQYIVQEPPDRIQFAQEAVDVSFFRQRFPEFDPDTGVAVDGLTCEPGRFDADGNRISDDDPQALYRPTEDFSAGAAPSKLRGVFAMVALQSGQVAFIDVEDLDAPCRRPTSTNAGAAADFHGCSGDPNAELPTRSLSRM
jgi:hypothetical protein